MTSKRKLTDLVRLNIALIILIASALGRVPDVNGHTPHTCPADLPDTPVLTRHVEHADIRAGRLAFDEVAAHGRALFTARFNRCDGQGRPETTGTGEARAAGAPDFMRMAEPEANSCAGCHHQPFAGGAGEFVANVFVNARGTGGGPETVDMSHVNERNTPGMHGAGFIEMLALMIIQTRWRVAITDRQLICRGDGFRGSLQRIRRDEIETVRHDATTNFVTVRSRDRREVKFRADWTGINAFEAALGHAAETHV